MLYVGVLVSSVKWMASQLWLLDSNAIFLNGCMGMWPDIEVISGAAIDAIVMRRIKEKDPKLLKLPLKPLMFHLCFVY